MSEPKLFKLNRRQLLSTGGYAMFGIGLSACGVSEDQSGPEDPSADVVFDSFVTIRADNRITIVVPDIEIGQGVLTTLAKIVADELEADWSLVDARIAPGSAAFANPLKGYQATGRSQSVRGFYAPLRLVGAAIRTMLIEAAAQRWGVPASACLAKDSYVHLQGSDRKLPFARLAEEASGRPIPDTPDLKSEDQQTLIGSTTKRLDSKVKAIGAAEYTIDLQLPNMLCAAIRHAPAPGGVLKLKNEDVVQGMPGVKAIYQSTDFVSVIADKYYQAVKALGLAEFEDEVPVERQVSSADYQAKLIADLGRADGQPLGDAPRYDEGGREIKRTYWAPFLAHATMEPMTCAALYEGGKLKVWAPTQGPALAQTELAKALGIAPEAISLERPFAGGGFGRRFFFDFCVEAGLIAKSLPGFAIKLIWSREEDMSRDFFRPAVAAQLTGHMGDDAKLDGLTAHVSCASILDSNFPGLLDGRPDASAFSGLNDTAYDLGQSRFVWHSQTSPVHIGMWRAVAHSQNGFFMETFIDECAHEAGVDPAAFRLAHCQADRRMTRIIETVMEMSEWQNGRALGIAAVQSYGSYVAQVVELESAVGRVRIKSVWCAVDCGRAIDPGGVVAQMNSGIIFGLSAALYGEITLDQGRVEQSNFHDYRMLSLAETPEIFVEIVNSGGELGGVGEPGLPPIAPALGNAIYATYGVRHRDLPFRLGEI